MLKPLMRRRTNFNLYLEKQLNDPDFRRKFRQAGKASDVAIQLASLRKKSGISQKALAKRVRTSQQQISRLESPSYEGHSLSMLRRVADVLGATVYVEIHGKKQKMPSVVAEGRVIYSAKGNDVRKRSELQKFERDRQVPRKPRLVGGVKGYNAKRNYLSAKRRPVAGELHFLREEKADIVRNLHIVEALYKEAVTLGIIPVKNPLDGVEVDLRIAKAVNSV